jgi:ankyrin repeat protein
MKSEISNSHQQCSPPSEQQTSDVVPSWFSPPRNILLYNLGEENNHSTLNRLLANFDHFQVCDELHEQQLDEVRKRFESSRDSDTGWSIIHLLIYDDCEERTLKRVVQLGIDLEMGDKDHWQPAHIAAFNGRLSHLQLLIACRVDIRAKNNWGDTPLDKAREVRQFNSNVRCSSLIINILSSSIPLY